MATQEAKNTTYLVTIADGADGGSTYQVTAAYTRTDQSNYPGFVLLHDEDKTLVALVPASPALLIRRQDSDPSMARRPVPAAGPVPRAPQYTPASRADLDRLAGRGGKAGRV